MLGDIFSIETLQCNVECKSCWCCVDQRHLALVVEQCWWKLVQSHLDPSSALLPFHLLCSSCSSSRQPNWFYSCLMATGWMCQKIGTPPIKWLLCIYTFCALRCYCLGITTGFPLFNKILLSWSTLFLITFLDKNNFLFPGVRIEIASVINCRGAGSWFIKSTFPPLIL